MVLRETLTLDLKRELPSFSIMRSAASSSERMGPFWRKSLMNIRVSTPSDLCRFVFIDIKFCDISLSIRLSELYDGTG